MEFLTEEEKAEVAKLQGQFKNQGSVHLSQKTKQIFKELQSEPEYIEDQDPINQSQHDSDHQEKDEPGEVPADIDEENQRFEEKQKSEIADQEIG